jgi:hypothetical protein
VQANFSSLVKERKNAIEESQTFSLIPPKHQVSDSTAWHLELDVLKCTG